MRTLAVIAVMQLGWTLYPPLSDAQPGTMIEPSAAVKTCIADYASGVEQSFTSLTEGVDFLMQKVCAGAVSEQIMEAARQQAETQKRKLKEACEADAAKAPKDNYTDGIRGNPALAGMCDDNPMANIFSDPDSMMPLYSMMSMSGAGPNIPSATTLAAQTLLQLRMQRLGKKM